MPETILVIAEQRPDSSTGSSSPKLVRVSLETIMAAQQISASTGWAVEALVLGGAVGAIAQELAALKVEKVYALESGDLAAYTSDGYVEALRSFLTEKQPRLVLMPHTYQVRDFAPRLALKLGRALIADCVGYKYEDGKLLFTRQMFQGKFAADVSFASEGMGFVTFQNGSFRADQVTAGSGPAPIETVPVTLPAGAIRVRAQEVFQEAKQAVDLTQAEIIVAVGRGIKEQKNLALAEELAKVLGGEIAASRPVCDAGWLPVERQVGSSGQTVAPKLYFSLGISGAIQHIVGMKGARSIVAINKDPEAPIFELADIGIVGDLFELVPAITAEIKKAKGV